MQYISAVDRNHQVNKEIASTPVLDIRYTILACLHIPTIQTELEWVDYLSKYQASHNNKNGNYTKVFQPDPHVHDYPEAVDWRTKGAVTAVKDQVLNCQFSVYVFVHWRINSSLMYGSNLSDTFIEYQPLQLS